MNDYLSEKGSLKKSDDSLLSSLPVLNSINHRFFVNCWALCLATTCPT